MNAVVLCRVRRPKRSERKWQTQVKSNGLKGLGILLLVVQYHRDVKLLCRNYGYPSKSHGNTGIWGRFQTENTSSRLDEPLKRKTPTTYFVNSMSDLFHEEIPFEFIEQVIKTIEKGWLAYLPNFDKTSRTDGTILPKSLCSQKCVARRDSRRPEPRRSQDRQFATHQGRHPVLSVEPLLEDLGQINLSDIHWVIVGGESGSRARPMSLEWVESIRLQCTEADVAFFFQTMGRMGADGKKRAKRQMAASWMAAHGMRYR